MSPVMRNIGGTGMNCYASRSRSVGFAAVMLGRIGARRLRQQPDHDRRMRAGAGASPGSPQDFVVNVGDRVFFESDSSELTPQASATLDKQAQWLGRYNRYAFTVEGHADERGTREYNIALGARRAQAVRDVSDLARRRGATACAPSPTARNARSRCVTTSRAGRRTAAP